MKVLDVIFFVFLIIGGLNWGLIGLWDFNLVAWLFGEGTTVSRVVYSLVGLSALYEIFAVRAQQRRWYGRREVTHVSHA